ncbi:MAG: hypothetical protein KAR19_20230 [Bacteroidales bacterium]|nr:hypothetical protein [Bacteroidales bacterium]
MKTLAKLLFIVACLGLVHACSKFDELVEEMPDAELQSAQPITVTVPFKADFTVWNHTDPTDRSCGDHPIYKITMKGEGIINHLGLITTTMTFCNNVGTGEYWDTDCIFIAANGDELYASIPMGTVIPNEEENSNYYSNRFNDDMFFVGGTGHFEGASGEAKTHAYVHLPTDDYIHEGDEVWHTDFFSTGELILVAGKR